MRAEIFSKSVGEAVLGLSGQKVRAREFGAIFFTSTFSVCHFLASSLSSLLPPNLLIHSVTTIPPFFSYPSLSLSVSECQQ